MMNEHEEYANKVDQEALQFSQGSDLNVKLWKACNSGAPHDLTKVKKYLDQGADPNWIVGDFLGRRLYGIRDLDGDILAMNLSCLHVASYEGYLPVVKELLNHKNINIAVKDRNGYSPLLYAVIRGHSNVSEYLITRGASLNNCDKNLLLFKACYENDINAVQEYLDQGADPNWVVEDMIGYTWTPAIVCCYKGHHEILNTLRMNGADIEAKDLCGQSPLMRACEYNHEEIVNMLINFGADINSKDEDSKTCLMISCEYGHHEVAKILINKGADINARDRNGWTPLMHAVSNGHDKATDIMINNGAEINAKDEDGWTPLVLAYDNRHYKLVDILINNGAHIDVMDTTEPHNDRLVTILHSLQYHVQKASHSISQHFNESPLQQTTHSVILLELSSSSFGSSQSVLVKTVGSSTSNSVVTSPQVLSAAKSNICTKRSISDRHDNTSPKRPTMELHVGSIDQ